MSPFEGRLIIARRTVFLGGCIAPWANCTHPWDVDQDGPGAPLVGHVDIASCRTAPKFVGLFHQPIGLVAGAVMPTVSAPRKGVRVRSLKGRNRDHVQNHKTEWNRGKGRQTSHSVEWHRARGHKHNGPGFPGSSAQDLRTACTAPPCLVAHQQC